MKTNLFTLKSLVLSTGLLVMISCVSETETPVLQENVDSLLKLKTEEIVGENLRKGVKVERAYFERFKNQITPVFSVDGLFFPGTGAGNSTHMGRASSFLNQELIFGPLGEQITIGAPVTAIYKAELEEVGLEPDRIPDAVSSITTDSKGNSVWFENIENIVQVPDENGIQTFEAQVQIIGGTGKFDGATGTGTVVGYFNSITGEGESQIRGMITF